MSNQNDGGPAFPRSSAYSPHGHQDGMSLRDYFAAAALSGCITKCGSADIEPGEEVQAMFSRRAYEVADAMLAAREVSK